MRHKPGNYALKAAENLQTLLEEKLPAGDYASLHDLHKALSEATPFFLAPNALELIWRTDLRAPLIGRLPYPRMAIEMDFHSDILIPDKPEADREVQRIALALEASVGIDEEGKVEAAYLEGTEPDSIVLSSLWRLCAGQRKQWISQRLGTEWGFSRYCMVIPFSSLREENFSIWYKGRSRFLLCKNGSSLDSPFLVKLLQGSDPEDDGYLPGSELVDELRTLLGLLNLLECSNVSTQVIPAPAKLNAKRAKRGKRPIPEYLTLNLSGGRETGASLTGSKRIHTSPRTHWRRGHIRRQRFGKKLEQTKSIWIQPVIVAGDEGESGTPKILVK